MKKIRHLPIPSLQKGIVLIEALIAMLLFSVGILGIVGLQATMIKGTTEGQFRAVASSIAYQRVAAMWVDIPANLANYVETDVDVSAMGLPQGRRTTTRGDATWCPGDLTCFIVTVTWQAPGGSPHSVVNVTHLCDGIACT